MWATKSNSRKALEKRPAEFAGEQLAPAAGRQVTGHVVGTAPGENDTTKVFVSWNGKTVELEAAGKPALEVGMKVLARAEGNRWSVSQASHDIKLTKAQGLDLDLDKKRQ